MTRAALRFILLSAIAFCACVRCYGQCNTESVEVDYTQNQIKSDELNIQRLGFKQTAGELVDWENLAREKTNELEHAAGQAVMDDLIAGSGMSMNVDGVKLKNGIDSIGSVKANEIVGRLQQVGWDDPVLANLIREYGNIGNKPKRIAKLRTIYGYIKDSRDLTRPPAVDDVDSTATIAGALADLSGYPGISLAMSNSQALVMLGYALKEKGLFEENIKELTSLSETKLLALTSAMNMLNAHVQNLRLAKQQYTDCQESAKRNPVPPPTITPINPQPTPRPISKDPCAGCLGCSSSRDGIFCAGCCSSK